MKVVFNNQENRSVCTCNVCGRIDKWSNWWRATVFGVGIGYKGEDRTFFTCSKLCRDKVEKENLLVKFKKKLHDEWWEANAQYVDDFEKEFKVIMDKEYEKQLKY